MNFLLSFFFTFNALAVVPTIATASSCRLALNPKAGVLDQLIDFEDRLGKIEQEDLPKIPSQSRNEVQQKIWKNRKATEEILEQLDSSDLAKAKIKFGKDLDLIDHSIEKLENFVATAQLRESNRDYKMLMEDPHLVRPETFYEIPSQYPYLKRVLFSREVVEDVFWEENSLMQRASELILRALLKKSGGQGMMGIDRFKNDHEIYKVRILGNAVGRVRIAGYFVGGDFYLVKAEDESKHSSHSSSALTDAVQAEKRRRGH